MKKAAWRRSSPRPPFFSWGVFETVVGHLFFPADMPRWLSQPQTPGLFAAGYLARPLGGATMERRGGRLRPGGENASWRQRMGRDTSGKDLPRRGGLGPDEQGGAFLPPGFVLPAPAWPPFRLPTPPRP
ncbi:hypothetical protein E0493_17470 [Roseomonas sp. M0104]|uniref:Uncharacterized protein n=1 Tax=Teichococcus coralli TaxID=2545983 RepID=A0A845BP12_9PROT|nr:hypothetical protein [Pseudoroseomonas coralli]